MVTLKNRNVMHIFPTDRILRLDVDTTQSAGLAPAGQRPTANPTANPAPLPRVHPAPQF